VIRGVDVVYLHSPHGDELATWFADTLGIPTKASFPGWRELDVGEEGSRLGIDVTSYPRSVVEKQAVMLSFRVDDIEAAVDDLAGKGVSFYPDRERTIFDVGPKLVATFCDPDGNREDRPGRVVHERRGSCRPVRAHFMSPQATRPAQRATENWHQLSQAK